MPSALQFMRMAGRAGFGLVWFLLMTGVVEMAEAAGNTPGNAVPEPAAVAVFAFGLAAVVRRLVKK